MSERGGEVSRGERSGEEWRGGEGSAGENVKYKGVLEDSQLLNNITHNTQHTGSDRIGDQSNIELNEHEQIDDG